MRYRVIFFVFLSLLCTLHAHAKPLDIRCVLEQAKENRADIKVTMQFQGDASGLSLLYLPNEWASQKELYRAIYDLCCRDHAVEDQTAPHVKRIQHAPFESLTISYKVKLQHEPLALDTCYRPFGTDSHFFFIGHTLFIAPLSSNTVVSLSLDWSKFPSNWTIANSYGLDRLQTIEETEFVHFQHAIFLGGDFELKKCATVSKPVYVALRGDINVSSDDFVASVDTIIQAQRTFWNDHEFPYYLVTAHPLSAKNAIVGTALTNAFTMYVGKYTQPLERGKNDLTFLLSHEHFHTWNGRQFRSCEPEGSMYWFSEGFTEYMAVKLNRRYAITSPAFCDELTRKILDEYKHSPYRTAPNERIVQDFWNNPEIARLPYVRGFAIALYLDLTIQKESGKKRCLDDFMHALRAHALMNKELFSLKEWLTILSQFVSAQHIEKVEKCFLFGALLDPLE